MYQARREPFIKRHSGAAAALLSGALLVLCFPTFDLYPLAFVALVPFLVSLRGMSAVESFRAGFLMGMPYFFGTQYWIYHSINHYGGVSLAGSVALVFLLACYLSLYTGLFGLLFSMKLRSTPLPALFLAPVLWVSLEFLRTYALTGFPWSSIGYTQWKFLPLIQVSDITGVYGVSFAVAAVNGAAADLFILRGRLRDMPLFHLRPTLVGFGIFIAAALGAFIYGNHRLHEGHPGEPFRAAVVQGNIRQDLKWDPASQREVIEDYKRLTVIASGERPDLILWPETAVPFYYGADKELTEELLEFQRKLDAYLLFGAVTVKGEGRLSNSAVLLDREGSEAYVYDKIHLVPFGEYVPLKKLLFFVDKIAHGIGEYSPGGEHIKAETPFGKFGTLICYEIIFPGLVRKFYRQDGDFIVTVTNDAWFGKTTGPYQHWSMAVFRAVENRKPLIRAANTGISGFIDSNGRVVKSSGLFTAEVVSADVTTDRRRSFYSRFGDLFSFLCLVAAVALLMNPGMGKIT